MAELTPYLKLNGIKMPDIKKEGATFADEKVWSKNTKRTASGKMTGDIVCIKKTVSLEFPPLTYEQIKLINSVVSNKSIPFFPFELCDGENIISKTVYAATPGYKLYSAVEGMRLYTGYKIDLVEQ